MKKINYKRGKSPVKLFFCFVLFVLATSSITAQSSPTPEKQSTAQIPMKQKVIHIFANQGPFGEMYLPKELAASSDVFKLVANQTRKEYFFPSIYFIVSAKPNLKEDLQRTRGDLWDYEYKNLSQSLEWLKIEIEAVVKNCDGTVVGDDNAIRILGLLPDESIARTEESSVAQGVAKGGELANAVVPFFPGASSIVETGTNVANVLFGNILYPPRLVTYRYSYIDNQRTFGWYWRADKTNNTSLLGLRRGVLLLQAKRKDVASIELKYSVYAKWNKDVDKNIDDEYVDLKNDLRTINLQSKCEEPKDKDFFQSRNYRFLENLSGFPMLIPEDVVCDIFQVPSDEATAENCAMKKNNDECLASGCSNWINKLVTENKEITFFTVTRPKKKLEDNKIVETNESQTIKLLRRSDLETLLLDRKKQEVREYRINVQQ